MKQVIFATFNDDKLEEAQAILGPEIEVISPSTHNLKSCEETEITFVENALQKARNIAKQIDLPVFADDSGLMVDVLGGEPGVFSGRFAGINATYQENRDKLKKELSKRNLDFAKGSFYCCTVFIREYKDPLPIIICCKWEGQLITEDRGSNGFGYDPMFYIPELNKTAAELTVEHKNRLSHRFQALSKLKKQLLQLP